MCVLTSYNVLFLSILQYHLAFYLSYFTRRCKCYLEQYTLKYTLYDLSNHETFLSFVWCSSLFLYYYFKFANKQTITDGTKIIRNN